MTQTRRTSTDESIDKRSPSRAIKRSSRVRTQWIRLTSIAVVVIALMLNSTDAAAQPFYIPLNGTSSIVLKNTSSEIQYAWISAPISNEFTYEEKNIEVPPYTDIEYNLSSVEKSFPWIQVKSYDEVSLTIHAKTEKRLSEVPAGRSEHIASPLVQIKQSGILTITNLVPIAQDGIILISSPFGRKSSLTLNLPKFGVEKVSLSVEKGDRIRIRGKYPLAASFISEDQKNYVHFHPDRTITEFNIKPTGAYFEMINQQSDQSFIFYTDDPIVLKEARHQVLFPEERKILFGQIQLGHNNVNRNLSSRLKTPWSWSVEKVTGFAYFGSLECDGSPSLVEDYLLPWTIGAKGICFWGYRILRELNPEEVRTGYSPKK